MLQGPLQTSNSTTVASPRPSAAATFLATMRLDMAEVLRARWFHFYTLVFCGVIGLLLGFGMTESRVMGFQGLSRTLVTYIQITMAVLPIFVLISTVRTIAADREAGVYEYMLALPIPLTTWYAGRLAGRFIVTALPVLAALALAVAWGAARGVSVPWRHVIVDAALLLSLIWCFLGMSFLISTLVRSADAAQTVAFLIWILLVAALDLVLLGLLIRYQIPAEAVVGIALINPLQVFRTGSMMLFDPQLILLGPAAWTLFDVFGASGFIAWAILYPVVLGTVMAGIGLIMFRRGDLI